MGYFGQNFRAAEKVLKAANRSRQVDLYFFGFIICAHKSVTEDSGMWIH